MADVLYKMLNPIVKTILRSPFHGIMSSNTLIIQYTGRKSGKAYSLPVSYARNGDQLSCFTARSNKWWLNLKEGRPVTLVFRGKEINTSATIETDDDEVIAGALAPFLQAVPRDAGPAGVRMDPGNVPNTDDVAAAATRLLWLQFDLPPST